MLGPGKYKINIHWVNDLLSTAIFFIEFLLIRLHYIKLVGLEMIKFTTVL